MLGSKNIVGLDIGSYAIKAVELNQKKKDKKKVYEVKKIGYQLLPNDAIVEGTIIDTRAVIEGLKSVFNKNKISNKNVVISISGNSVIIKKISLPQMEQQELDESIIWEAKHNIPYPYDETNVDYTVLNPQPGSGNTNLDILLVAAKKDKITNYTNVVSQANKNLKAIEVDVFALQNSMEINYPETLKDNTVVIINLGANTTNVVIIEKKIPQLFRDLSVGGLFFTENMRKELNISFENAEKALRGIPVEDIPNERIEPIL
ncbi:MAG: type IV pilus biogenesis protein PilM, partial [Candidatus Aminicenantaceae bacterium]